MSALSAVSAQSDARAIRQTQRRRKGECLVRLVEAAAKGLSEKRNLSRVDSTRGASDRRGTELAQSVLPVHGPPTTAVPPFARAHSAGSYMASSSTGGSAYVPEVTARTV